MNPISVPLNKVNGSNVDSCVAVRGKIVGAGQVQLLCLKMEFLCDICTEEFMLDQPGGIFTLPRRCGVSKECKNKSNFTPMGTSDKLVMKNYRIIKLQDVESNEVDIEGVPKSILCELTNDLVYQCNVGDTVTVTGIVKMDKNGLFEGEKSLRKLYIEASGIRNFKEAEKTMGGNWYSFSNKDFYAVREMYDTPNLLKLLVASLCPCIYGHELVKASLILSLFGGASHSNDVFGRRSDINILMIGDPGIGKSQMLQIIKDIAPRGVYVCGTGSTIAGLTVTLVRDGDEYSLESGALVMADRGVCCIDEFDKMIPQHPALLEAMEQQSVSIAKAGVLRTLAARTTVIAAANPIGGHYDQTKSLSENIKISTALLSRFDITFILLDKADTAFDDRVVSHIMGRGIKRPISVISSSQERLQNNPRIPLSDRLKVEKSEVLDLIPHCLIRKYIAYARQYVKPKISPEASKILKDFYLNLRIEHRLRESTPITTRQLESLARLTEARAKVELRETATADDARDVLEIFQSSLSSAFDDEVIAVTSNANAVMIQAPAFGKASSKNQAKQLAGALQKSADQQSKSLFAVGEIKCIIKSLGLTCSADQLIAILNNENYLLMKSSNVYKLTTVDY